MSGSDGGGMSTSAARSGKRKRSPKLRARACDQCRRRKVKCDAARVNGPRCTSCVAFKFECTFVAGTEKRFSDVNYVTSLEKELEEMRQLCLKQQTLLSTYSAPTDAQATSPITRQAHPIPQFPSPTPGSETPFTDNSHNETKEFISNFSNLDLRSNDVTYIGGSSSLTLIHTAVDMKRGYAYGPKDTRPARRPTFWGIRELVHPEAPYTDFPEPALMYELVDKFFEIRQPMIPLLHRPTFEGGLKRGLHLRDEGFGATVLLVCALGSKNSGNLAVLPNGADNWHMAGWKWFEQVRSRRKLAPLTAPTVYDLQVACLLVSCIASSATPKTSCALLGHGLRLALDMGAHRRTTYPAKPTAESELKKRAFWCLLAADREMSLVSGRPCTIQDEDIDVDYPIECDDEYWLNDDPGLAFRQPEGKPSIVTFSNWILRLMTISTVIFRALYSLSASKRLANAEHVQYVVSELDSELNKWLDSLPLHLKWDPSQPNCLFADQSASLYAHSCYLRILIHRPFIPMPHKPSPSPIPSLMICTNAARSCIQVLDRHYHRFGPDRVLPWCQVIVLTSAIILLLNIWGGKRTGLVVDTAKETEEVDKALQMLQVIETRYNSAGRLWDILYDLRTVVDEPGRQHFQAQKRKSDENATRNAATSTSANVQSQEPRKRLHKPTAPLQWLPAASSLEIDHTFDLSALHGDLTAPSSSAGFDFTDLEQTFGAVSPGNSGQHAAASSMEVDDTFPTEPDFEAIFADLLPTAPTYEEPFTAFMQRILAQHGPFPSTGTTGMVDMQQSLFVDDTGPSVAECQGDASEPNATASQSTGNAGPGGMLWDTYLTNVSSIPLGHDHFSSEPQ